MLLAPRVVFCYNISIGCHVACHVTAHTERKWNVKKFKKIYLKIINWPPTLPICAVLSLAAVLYSGFTTYDIAKTMTPGARHYIKTEPIRPDGVMIEIPTGQEEWENSDTQTGEDTYASTDVLLQIPEALPEQTTKEEYQTALPELPSTELPTTKPPAQTTKPQTSVTEKPPSQTTKPQSKPTSGWSVTYAQAKSMVRADSAYDYEDLYWLSRIISAEAKGESFTGQIGVGTVVLNRVRSREFPNTIKGVVFDRKYGTQFTPVANGSIYDTPTKSAVVAAKMCLDGYVLSDSVLYFVNPSIATSSWIQNNRKYAFRVGNHEFYH